MFAGIDIGGTSIKGVLTDKNGKELSFKTIPTPETARDIDSSIITLLENLATSVSISRIDIEAIGIGAAGAIDRAKGLVITSPNIPSWKKHPLAKNIEKLSGVRVLLENDATAALIGAWWKGNGSRFKHWIMITLGTGIGGGLILNNRVYTGQSGNAMEIGHMTIDFNGRPCSCGNKGCLEQYASATALVNLAKELLDDYPDSSLHERNSTEKLTAEIIFEEASKKDPCSIEAFNKTAYYLGIGVANLVNIFNPEAVIFGGGLSQAHKLFIPVVKKVVKERALAGLKDNVKYMPIKDQSRIPALGAAKIAIDASKQ